MLSPYIANMAYIPLDILGGYLPDIKSRLTVYPKVFGENDPDPIFLYDLNTKGYIGVPTDWGITNFNVSWEDRTSRGNGVLLNATKKVDPYHPNAPAGQDEFINNMISTCGSHYTCFALADTAAGKTPSSLAVEAHFNLRTLVVVDRHDIADQWIAEIKDKLGIPASRIAKIAGKNTVNYTASICVALVHTLASTQFNDDFYSSFGCLILDEVHALGSRSFSKVISMFNSTIKLGLTATDERGDRAEICYRSALGNPRVKSSAASMPLEVYRVSYSNKPLYGDFPGLQLNQLVQDKKRNAMIADIVTRAYVKGRNILVASDRIEHLEELLERCVKLGIPRLDVGLYAGQETTKNGKRVHIKKKERDEIKKRCPVIFATYGLCQKALNIPRLDFGIDATPRATAKQLIGRVRRLVPGKLKPVWITIMDNHSDMFQAYYYKRLKDYTNINAEVFDGLPEWLDPL